MSSFLNKSKFHFIGIGGIGMCGLAELLKNIGAQVTGSDLSENANTQRLKSIGIKILKGHAAENIGEPDVVVYSSAVKFNNPEILEAVKKKIPIIPRAEALAEIMRLKRGIAVGGTHGKTTTTSMCASIFLEAGVHPTIVIGGRFDQIDSTAKLGSGEWMLAEADESDGSFHKLSPEISIITNIDSDHLDFYENFENLKKSFYEFLMRVPFYGLGIVCGDDPVIHEVFRDFPKRIVSYGFEAHNDYVISGEKGHYKIKTNSTHHLKIEGDFELQAFGRHNALNATAALLSGVYAGIDFKTVRAGLKHYQGVDRRFQLKGEKNKITVYDDYGHHPTEIRATLQAFREKFPDRRVVILFQPHRFSRTEICWDEFLTCFSEADQVYISDIYAAGELPRKSASGLEINSERMVKEIKHKSVEYVPAATDKIELLKKSLKAGDVFVTLGAGDNWKVGMQLLENLT